MPLFWPVLQDSILHLSCLDKKKKRKSNLLAFVLIGSVPILLMQALHYAQFANQLVLVTGILMLAYIFILHINSRIKQQRIKCWFLPY